MPEVLISTSGITREEWLQERRKGIGGSDAAKVLGVSRWGGPLSVYLEKTGAYVPGDPGEAAYWGIILEPVIADEFSKRTGFKVMRQNKIFQHKDAPWMIANVDRVLVGQNKGLECKAASAWLADAWNDDSLPDEYYIQIQHYNAVMGWDSCYVAVLLGGNRFDYKEVQRDEHMIGLLMEREREFWHENVLKGIPPEITLYDNPQELFEQKDELILTATPEVEEVARNLVLTKRQIKELEDKEKALKNTLSGFIGEHAGIDGICTWRQEAGRVSWKDVANHFNPPEEILEKYRAEGVRVLRMKKDFEKVVA